VADPTPACVIVNGTELFVEDPIQREEQEGNINFIGYDDLGGVRAQLTQIKEMVELPLRHPQLFRSIGIKVGGVSLRVVSAVYR
jgi:transitional endoplasmic reticulum ATPase